VGRVANQAAFTVAVASMAILLSRAAPYALPLARVCGGLGVAVLCLLALGAVALPVAWIRAARRPEGDWLRVRALGYVVAGACCCCWFAFDEFSALACELALGAAVASWSIGCCLPWPRRLARLFDRVAVATLSTVLLFEIALRLLVGAGWLPILVSGADGSEQAIRANLLQPGDIFLGSRVNRLGFHDDEFATPPERNSPVVAVIGDSFVVGIVPHPYLFTSVCERELGIDVYSFGVRAVGLPEYCWLLRNRVRPVLPSLVVVCLFVGNDLPDSEARRSQRVGWLVALSPDSSMLLRAVHRLGVVLRTPAPGLAQDAGTVVPRDRLAEAYPFVEDWTKELPTLALDDLAALERRIAARLADPGRIDTELVRARLAELAELAGPAPLAVVVFPDSLQIQDELGPACGIPTATFAAARDAPQRLVIEACRAVGIPCLDLAPVLRAAAPERDGSLHVYHLRDTHLNAKGNRIAGLAIAEFLRPLLPRR
jgi:hypothetical protein